MPTGSTVAIVSKGDDRLLDITGRIARHFPEAVGGGWVGHHPGDSAEAVRHVDAARTQGASYLAFPAPSVWWLDFYNGLAQHLEREGTKVVAQPACVIYALERDPEAAPASAVS